MNWVKKQVKAKQANRARAMGARLEQVATLVVEAEVISVAVPVEILAGVEEIPVAVVEISNAEANPSVWLPCGSDIIGDGLGVGKSCCRRSTDRGALLHSADAINRVPTPRATTFSYTLLTPRPGMVWATLVLVYRRVLRPLYRLSSSGLRRCQPILQWPVLVRM